MKKYALLLALLPTLLFAQTPFGYHATWTFEYHEAGFSGVDSLYHAGDTVYLGETWQYLKRSFGGNGNMMVQTINDTVYFLQNGQKRILYDFSAGVGDSWNFASVDTNFGCLDTPMATVLSLGFDTVSGTAIQYQMVEDVMDTMQPQSQYRCSSAYCLGGKIYKRVGQFGSILNPQFNLCDGTVFKANSTFMYNLRCYHDDDISVNFTAHDCKTGIGLEEENLAPFKIYPNPSSGSITIDASQQIIRVEVRDLTGRLLAVYKNQTMLELPQQSGLYLLNITFKNGEKAVQKVIRE